MASGNTPKRAGGAASTSRSPATSQLNGTSGASRSSTSARLPSTLSPAIPVRGTAASASGATAATSAARSSPVFVSDSLSVSGGYELEGRRVETPRNKGPWIWALAPGVEHSEERLEGHNSYIAFFIDTPLFASVLAEYGVTLADLPRHQALPADEPLYEALTAFFREGRVGCNFVVRATEPEVLHGCADDLAARLDAGGWPAVRGGI